MYLFGAFPAEGNRWHGSLLPKAPVFKLPLSGPGLMPRASGTARIGEPGSSLKNSSFFLFLARILLDWSGTGVYVINMRCVLQHNLLVKKTPGILYLCRTHRNGRSFLRISVPFLTFKAIAWTPEVSGPISQSVWRCRHAGLVRRGEYPTPCPVGFLRVLHSRFRGK